MDSSSPFVNEVFKNLTPRQRLQVIVMSLTIAPLRCFIIILLLIIAQPITFIISYKQDMVHTPIMGWRRIFLWMAGRIGRALYFVAGFHHIRMHGTPDMTVPVMPVAPHYSFFDMILSVQLGFTNSVARMGLDTVPLFGPLIRLSQPIIVNREQVNSRTITTQVIMERALRTKYHWSPTIVFPEGTCTNGKELIKFKNGAFIPGVPVQPVGVKYDLINRFDSYSYTWVAPGFRPLAWLTLCQLSTRLEFVFMPVYHPNEEEKANASLYAENVRKYMGEYMKIPLSEYSYEDARLMHVARQHGLPCHSALIKLHSMRKKHNITDFEDVYKMMPTYARIADKETGVCYLGKFAQNLGIKECEATSRLFNLFDTENKGHFDFATFMPIYYDQMFKRFHNENGEVCIERILTSLSKFKNGMSSISRYTFDELNSELRTIFDLEYTNPSVFKNTSSLGIQKKCLEEHFKQNLLDLYLFTSSLNKETD